MMPATMAAILGLLLPLLLLDEELPLESGPAAPVSVVVAPAEFVTVYVIALPVASGPFVAVCAGAVTVAPPVDAPPTIEITAAGTW